MRRHEVGWWCTLCIDSEDTSTQWQLHITRCQLNDEFVTVEFWAYMLGSYFKEIKKTGCLQPASGSVKITVCMNGFNYTGFSQAQTYLDHRILGQTHMKQSHAQTHMRQIQEAWWERQLQSSSDVLPGLPPVVPVALALQVPRTH